MTQTQSIAEGDRIYATETIHLYDGSTIPAGSEGEVVMVPLDDTVEFMVNWDLGECTGVIDIASVALV